MAEFVWCQEEPYNMGAWSFAQPNIERVLDFIGAIEKSLGMAAEKRLLPLQDGDVPATYADTALLNDWVGFVPATPIQEGVSRFIAWYRDYYKV